MICFQVSFSASRRFDVCFGQSPQGGAPHGSPLQVLNGVDAQMQLRFRELLNRCGSLPIIDDVAVHPNCCIYVEGAEVYGAIAEDRVQPAWMSGTKEPTPNGTRLCDTICPGNIAFIEVGHRREMPSQNALVPTGVVPALVVTTVDAML